MYMYMCIYIFCVYVYDCIWLYVYMFLPHLQHLSHGKTAAALRISQVPAGRQDLLRGRPQFDITSCAWIEILEIVNPHEVDY